MTAAFRRSLLWIGLFLSASCASALEPIAGKTLMTERGKLIFADRLDQPLGPDWRVLKGAWSTVDGSMQVKELTSDMHGAVARRAVPHANFIVQYSFKLEGTKRTTLSINDALGHCCRVLIDTTGLSVQKDSHDKNKTDKVAVLQRKATPIAANQWHTLVVEVLGPEIVASVNGKVVAFGAHESINVPKKDIGLTVAGESAAFKDLQVWEALPNKAWAATRETLEKKGT